MPRPRHTLLRERPGALPRNAKVIDAQYSVVRSHTWLKHLGGWLLAIGAAAAIGFLIPPLWVMVAHLLRD